MSQVQVDTKPDAAPNQTLKLVVSILSGPLAFLLVQSLPLAGLDPRGQFGLSKDATERWGVTLA